MKQKAANNQKNAEIPPAASIIEINCHRYGAVILPLCGAGKSRVFISVFNNGHVFQKNCEICGWHNAADGH